MDRFRREYARNSNRFFKRLSAYYGNAALQKNSGGLCGKRRRSRAGMDAGCNGLLKNGKDAVFGKAKAFGFRPRKG
jgi:hypothetical protein